MYKKIRKLLYLTTIMAVLLMSAMPSYAVYANGGPEGDQPDVEPPITEAADPPAEEAGDFTAAEEPAEEPSGDEGDPAPAEAAATLPEVLEQVPEETDLVVINEEGGAEPLASQAAAEILIEGDPIWCPQGQAPTPGSNGCTTSHLGFDDLIGDLASGSYSGDGVIWVASNYDPDQDSASIVFNGNNGNLGNLIDITVQGGWDGNSGSTSVDPSNPSTLDDRLRFRNWTGNITISTLAFQNTSGGASLQINTDGDITVDNVTASGSTDAQGANLNNCLASGGVCTGSGSVTVVNSEFNNNFTNGINIHSTEDVLIKDVSADSNGRDGINVTTHNAADANVTIIDTTVTNNIQDGIQANDVGGDLSLKGVAAADSGSEGIVIDGTLGDVKISNTTTTGNNNEGIEIDNTRGDVKLRHVTANDSTNHEGVDIHNTNGNLWLKDVTAENNSREGVEIVNVDGSLGIYCSQASNNGQDGFYVQIDHDFVIKCSQSNDNGVYGVEIVDAPTAQLLSFTATGNGNQDIDYDPAVTTVTEKKVDCSGKEKPSKGDNGLFTKLYCLPGEIKVALYDTYGDKIEFDNLCGYDAGVFDPNSWAYPETIPGGGDDYITSLQEKMLEEIPNLEPVTEYGLPGILAQVLDELPFMLPDDYSYASAFFTAVLDEGEYMDPLPEESGLTVRFRVPGWLDPGEVLTILWWDGAEWVDLGGEYSEDGYYFQVTTEETGVFVLAVHEIDL